MKIKEKNILYNHGLMSTQKTNVEFLTLLYFDVTHDTLCEFEFGKPIKNFDKVNSNKKNKTLIICLCEFVCY